MQLIHRANREGLKVRVHGSGHSVNAAIYTGDFSAPPPSNSNVDIYLDHFSSIVETDDSKMHVTIQAGCHLGVDPYDPVGKSNVENSLFYQLDQMGWAFPDTGGITHQTVAGFLATGSSGGSIRHSVGKQIVAFKIIDGTGKVHLVEKPEDENPDDNALETCYYGRVVDVKDGYAEIYRNLQYWFLYPFNNWGRLHRLNWH